VADVITSRRQDTGDDDRPPDDVKALDALTALAWRTTLAVTHAEHRDDVYRFIRHALMKARYGPLS